MKIVVFGTGKYYENRKEDVLQQEVIAFLDNNPSKQGRRMDNRLIYSPEKVLDLKYDYILLMGKEEYCDDMRWQLLQLGVERDVILQFEEFCNYNPQKEMRIYYTIDNGNVFGNADKRIVILSNELSAGDTPRVLLNAGIIMKKNGYFPVIVSPKDGSLRHLAVKNGISVIIEKNIHKNNLCIWEWMTTSAFVWVNTNYFNYLIEDLEESGVKAAWWLHNDDFRGIAKIDKRKIHIPIYGLGIDTVKSINNYFKGGGTNLFYGIPDQRREKRLCFAIVGRICIHKGQDIFVDAVRRLSKECRDQAEFKIIGDIEEQHLYDEIISKMSDDACIDMIGSIDDEELSKLYQNIDVIVCPSRKDTMPMVVAEGLMNHKICVVSSATGWAEVITDGQDGFVSEIDAEHLAEKMSWIINHQEELESICDAAGKLYKKYFTMEVFEKNILNILEGKDVAKLEKERKLNEQKTVFVNAFPSQEFYEEGLSWQRKLELLANNTGNLLYVEALKKQIDYDVQAWLGNPGFKTDEFSAGVIPTSNILRKYYSGAVIWADLMEKAKFPITLAGLGAQSFSDCLTPRAVVEQLSEEMKDAFRKMSYQTCSLGVRGEFTAECLRLMGISNYRIIGCPSFYYNLDGSIDQKPEPTLDKVTVNMDIGRSISGKVLDMGIELNAEWIMQADSEKPEILFNDKSVKMDFLKKYCGTMQEMKNIKAYIMRHAHMFFDLNTWSNYLRNNRFTFSFGMRFHGNMMSYLCGIPTLWITHDSRTRELTETLKLPHIDLEDYKNVKYTEELLEKCDYTETYRNYAKLLEEYIMFLEENGLKHKFVV